MTENHEPTQACCESPVGNVPDRDQTQQRCCDDSVVPEDSPRADIQNDCCGTEVSRETPSDRVTLRDAPRDDQQPTDRSECGDASPPIAPNDKSADELARLERAAQETTELLTAMERAWHPHWSEADVGAFLHDAVQERGMGTAWTEGYCPAVHAGPDAAVGHVAPGDRTVSPGDILHVDFGVAVDGYVADLQRVFYRKADDDSPIPSDLQTAFTDVRAALEAGRDVLVPGVPGYQVDAVARRELTSRGWDEINHAFGHQVGTIPHDRGTLLGPLWERYGDNPRGVVHSDEVYCLELGVGTPYGYVGLEEMVRVTDDGARYLIDPQTEIKHLTHRPAED